MKEGARATGKAQLPVLARSMLDVFTLIVAEKDYLRCFAHSHGGTGCGAALLCFRITTILGKPAHLLRNSHAPLSHSILRYYYTMARGTQQTREDSPRFTIDCVLANVSTQLQADGCVLESVEEGHKLITPGHLRVGDTG